MNIPSFDTIKNIIPLKIMVLLGAVLVILLILTIVSIFQSTTPTQTRPIPTPISISTPLPTFSRPNNNSTSFSKSIIGETTDTQISSMPNLKSKNTTNGQTEYLFSTLSEPREDVIITKNGKVIFERAVTLDANYNHPLITEFTSELGAPELQFKGSNYYGENFGTDIYASQGIAIVYNLSSKEVYEINTFPPTTVEDYISKWGSDLREYPSDAEHL